MKYRDDELDNDHNYWKRRVQKSKEKREVVPSFRDVSKGKYNLFKQLNNTFFDIQLTYSEWCDIWIDSGMIDEYNKFSLVPGYGETVLTKANVLIILKEHVKTHIAKLEKIKEKELIEELKDLEDLECSKEDVTEITNMIINKDRGSKNESTD